MADRFRHKALLACYVAAAASKIWLTLAFGMRAAADRQADDALFIALAESLVHGQWLGDYDRFTLVKGPFFPIWIAMMFYANIPLMLSYQLLHLFACILVVLALRPILPNRWLGLLLFVVLLFDPTMYSGIASWVVRAGVYVPLTMIVFACTVALLSRLDQRPGRIAGWSIGLGVTLAAIWTTREEGIWIVPGLAIAAVYGLVTVWRHRASALLKSTLLLLPAGICIAGVLIVCALNYSYYGIFNTVEFKNTAFKRAVGALMRVEHDDWNQYALVPQEVRERIYDVSPAFAELAPFFEGPIGQARGRAAERWLEGGTPSPQDIRGGWFVWAFREAAARQGYHATATEAEDFYSRVADEVNAACGDGRLTCGPERASLTPPWRDEYVPLLADSFLTGLVRMLMMDEVVVQNMPSTGSGESRVVFEDLGRTRLNPAWSIPGPGPRLPNQTNLNEFRFDVMEWLNRCYRFALPAAAILSFIAMLVIIVSDVRTRQLSPILVLIGVLFVSFAARMSILAMISVTSFEAMRLRHFAPLYPILLLFSFLALYQAGRILRSMPAPTLRIGRRRSEAKALSERLAGGTSADDEKPDSGGDEEEE